jgi:hypothetical protein
MSMPPKIDVFSVEQMKQQYGLFFTNSPRVQIDCTNVPKELWSLIPYAEFWGIADDWARESLVRQAPPEIQKNLKSVVSAFNDALDVWLAGDEADSPSPSREYIAFSAMRMAADFI